MPRLTDTEKQMYQAFANEFRVCWSCRFQPLPIEFNRGLYRNLENAHIVGGAGRVADRRAIVRLCKAHHMLEQGETLRWDGKPLPRLTLAQMVWLKLRFDPDHFEITFLNQCQRNKNGILQVPDPMPVEPIGIHDNEVKF